MKDRILSEPAFALGAFVWLVAASVFPWQLGLFWTIGLSVPASVLFALGSSAAPATAEFADDLCVMAGLDNPADHAEDALEEALEPGEQCEVGG